jgi:putative ABC transport system permease protein
MLKNYVKIAFRNIIKSKGYSSINIVGLALGMACCILILLWAQHELSFNRFHKNKESIYRAYQINRHAGGATPFSNLPQPVGPELQSTIPGIKHAIRVLDGDFTVKYGDKIFNERGVLWIDPAFFDIFSFPFLEGEPLTSFADPYSVVLTKSTAEKYFGTEDPIGKVLTIDGSDQMKITGVVQDAPDNSTLQFDFLVPYSNLNATGFDVNQWKAHICQIYVQLEKNALLEQVSDKITGLLKKHLPELDSDLKLQPLLQIRLYTLGGELGTMKYVIIFSIIAFFVLVIASINFMSLSTARSAKRAREVGLRKVIGARRSQVVRQFLGESLLITLLAFGLALVLVETLMPLFNQLSEKNLSLNLSSNIFMLFSLLGIALFTGFLAGSYPAFFLSSFLPVKALKGATQHGTKSTSFRKALVVFQFSLSIMLIISTVVIHSQLQYILTKDLGFNRDNLVYIPMNESIGSNFDVIKSEMLQNPNVMNVTRTFQIPSYNKYSSEIEWEGQTADQNINFNISIADPDYLATMNIPLVQGRNFSARLDTDKSNCLINEEAAKRMGLKSPLGTRITLGKKRKIIGVVKDYHYMPFSYAIEPLILVYSPIMFRYAMARISGTDTLATIGHIEKIWNKFAPDYPFEYHFIDEDYERIYGSERRMGLLFRYFTVLAIVISCLGLFGLASFTAEQRTKEIGIRKILGASVVGLAGLLSKEFTKLVLMGNAIAWPAAYFVMKKWLEGFAYRIDISLTIFLLSGLLAFVVAVLTVSYQAIKAAIANPVDSLRYE